MVFSGHRHPIHRTLGGRELESKSNENLAALDKKLRQMDRDPSPSHFDHHTSASLVNPTLPTSSFPISKGEINTLLSNNSGDPQRRAPMNKEEAT